jgi:ketosteroid isomerase-like protein
MYHAFVRRQITANFSNLGKPSSNEPASQGSGGLAPNVHHVFAGANAIGGERHSAAGFKLWLERVYRIFPNLNFAIKRVIVSGWPWDTTATVEWHSEATSATGEPYVNDGVHVIHMKNGKILSMHVFLDTERVSKVLKIMADKGFSEAGAPPIED